jgi:hypothetical protein
MDRQCGHTLHGEETPRNLILRCFMVHFLGARSCCQTLWSLSAHFGSAQNVYTGRWIQHFEPNMLALGMLLFGQTDSVNTALGVGWGFLAL